MSKLGKSIADDILAGVTTVTKAWTKQRKAEERQASARWRRDQVMSRADRWTIKDAAWDVMEEAYLKASANHTLPANARQIMYAARPRVQDKTGEQLESKYFTQVLLPDYINEYEPDWDVVFDDRGHFHEPHTDLTFGLGTLAVREYLSEIGDLSIKEAAIAGAQLETAGPDGCYDAILFIEKEGFMPLFEAVNLANRYDIAIMSTKGLSVTAARHLIDEICGDHNIPCWSCTTSTNQVSAYLALCSGTRDAIPSTTQSR
jgi:hypothetical protein